MAYEIIVVGTSWGGLVALGQLIDGLPQTFELPMVIIQHRHKGSGQLMQTLLQSHTSISVCEVEDKTSVVPGRVFIAPPDYHVLFDDEGSFALSTEAPVRYSRPSIDVTFESAADVYGEHTVGVVLTGANADGARGLKRIVDRGGLALAESPMMPTAALRSVPGARQLTIPQIAATLGSLPAMRVGGAR